MAEGTVSPVFVVPITSAEHQELLEALWKHERLGGEHYRYVRKIAWGVDTRFATYIYQGSNEILADDWQQLRE